MKNSLLILAALLLAAPASRGQLVKDGATNTIDNATNTVTGTVTIGTNGSFTLLVLTNNALLTNSAHGVIGRGSTARSNALSLVTADTRWLLGNNLIVGSNGAFNRLLVSGGVTDNQGFLGFTSSSSNNGALVTGSGSFWSNANELYVGYNGKGNQLVVSNGALVQNSAGYVGQDARGNNTAVVTGLGSSWNNAGDLSIGVIGAGNRLLVSDGGLVRNNYALVGVDATSSNNAAVVTGSGSVWTNALDLYIGQSAKRNQLVISNGAVVLTAGHAFTGYNTNAAGNAVTVTDPGTRWLIGSNFWVGSNGPLSRLVVSNGAFVANGLGTIGHGVSSVSNVVVVTGTNSLWSNTSNLLVGLNGRGNRLVINQGGIVQNDLAEVGSGTGSNNLVVVTDPGSIWTNASDLVIGGLGGRNQLVVSNGGTVLNLNGHVGVNSSSSSNAVFVTGLGSVWSNAGDIFLGESGRGNRLVISGGGTVVNAFGFLGAESSGSNNLAVVTDTGSVWRSFQDLVVGSNGARNRLVISNSGTVFAANVLQGVSPASTNNRIELNGGALLVTNSSGDGILDIRRGTNVLTAGRVEVDRLVMTNVLGVFEFKGGTLVTAGTSNSNGRVFTVGNGTNAATLELRGGQHVFSSNVVIAGPSRLMGHGTIIGTLTVGTNGILAPGESIGTLALSNSPVWRGITLLRIGKDGSALTNDQIQVANGLTYGGSLSVSNIGPTGLTLGDRFKLFDAGAYAGSFTQLSLPSLGAGLGWTNRLLADGSIGVVATRLPRVATITLSGTNVVITGTNGTANSPYTVLTSTNVVLALSNWTSVATYQYGPSGEFSFTNAIEPQVPQRFYLLRSP
jgi:fibronectin-binding autotransporter adhesin